MKRLPPSIRQKKRYMKFRIHSEEEFELGKVVDAFWDSILDYSGAEGASRIDPWIIGNLFDEDKQEGVFKVRSSEEDTVRAALTLLESVDGEEAFVEITRVSGSLEKLKRS